MRQFPAPPSVFDAEKGRRSVEEVFPYVKLTLFFSYIWKFRCTKAKCWHECVSRNIKKFTLPFFTRSSIFHAYFNSIKIDSWKFKSQLGTQNFISFLTQVFVSLHGLRISRYLSHIEGWYRKILPRWSSVHSLYRYNQWTFLSTIQL